MSLVRQAEDLALKSLKIVNKALLVVVSLKIVSKSEKKLNSLASWPGDLYTAPI